MKLAPLSIEIQNFNQVNIFVGDNGIGKTKKLSAIFRNLKKKKNVIFLKNKISIQNKKNFSLIASISNKQKNEIIILLQKICPYIINIFFEESLKKIFVYDEERKRNILPKTYGNGFSKALAIALSVFGTSDVVLIDEFENGLYKDSHRKIYESIFPFFKESQKQLFITTHSCEVIEALFQSAKKINFLDKISVFRLEKNKKNKIELTHYSKEKLTYAIETQREVR